MNVAEFVAARLGRLGAVDVFSVTGGAAMHLNRAFATAPNIRAHYLHHEQACAMAAEGYARLHWRPAVVCVTAGPGSINAMNGVFGAFTDSVPMFVVSGQPRTETLGVLRGPAGIRQLGDQESPIIDMVQPIVKAAHQLRTGEAVGEVVDALWVAATTGRPGPVWLDIPVDVQARVVRELPDLPLPSSPPALAMTDAQRTEILSRLTAASRPLILAGTGIRAAGMAEELQRLSHALQVPVATAWTHDIFDNSDALFAGRPGTIGTRSANLVLQQADVILVLGSRLNIRQTGYAWEQFAPEAFIMQIDVDPAELAKQQPRVDLVVAADLAQALPALTATARPMQPRGDWLHWIAAVRSRYEPQAAHYQARVAGINPYHFMFALDGAMDEAAVLVCGNATACIVPFQTVRMVGQRRMFSNSGSASMGYDLPAAIGAAIAAPARRVVCLAGDGSIMMNLQELATLANSGADVALIILENQGYLSIRETQRSFFGEEHGTGEGSGLAFPDFVAVARAFGLPTVELISDSDWEHALSSFLGCRGPRVCVVRLDPGQGFEPRLRSRMTAQGIVSPSLDDMYPYLSDDELQSVRAAARSTNGAEL